MVPWSSWATTHQSIPPTLEDMTLILGCIRHRSSTGKYKQPSQEPGIEQKICMSGTWTVLPVGHRSLTERLRLMSQQTKCQWVLFLHQVRAKQFRPEIPKLQKDFLKWNTSNWNILGHPVPLRNSFQFSFHPESKQKQILNIWIKLNKKKSCFKWSRDYI